MQSAFGHIRHRGRGTYICNLVTTCLMRFTTLLVAVTVHFLPGYGNTILFRSTTCHAFPMKVYVYVYVSSLCSFCFCIPRNVFRADEDYRKCVEWSLPQKLLWYTYIRWARPYFQITLSFLIRFCIIYFKAKSGFSWYGYTHVQFTENILNWVTQKSESITKIKPWRI